MKKDALPHKNKNRPNIVKSIVLIEIFFKKFTEDSYKLSGDFSSRFPQHGCTFLIGNTPHVKSFNEELILSLVSVVFV
ncbi:hypothetical protein IG612_10955 [Pectobacterium sp. FL60-S17]|uniref:Uncharacterized protein n=1 Tax=Pectobacterium quasiaquaticum TaxID=2774015 RepID=A0A9Q2EQ10_9GAMM|nr:hypothetical protein [Pectobacterium quasiaquaticum]MBE5203123.1 hypothetical protein [Pectobacterium quasiaquaticum]MBE5209219.1 hypothetical protein [Pectobacterium quasiaquaticum]MBE5213067.1 hypothetical protein [Pectobacterium quasiaquaticum]MBE5220886.1 hypothetical protein [Pectobacterium quasiaquaticum]MBE5224283.1 hypothetical protein [Pectobacterium quasiaquaticum]